MILELTAQQQQAQADFHSFVHSVITPHADQYDQEEQVPLATIQQVAAAGYLGAIVPASRGGTGSDLITFGLLHEAVGQGCSSIRSLLTVHSMVAHVLLKWGSKQLQAEWLPRLITGETIAAFGLTEPNAGSDAQSIETTARLQGDYYVLNGTKKWITFGQIADLFLIFAKVDGKHSAFLVERTTPGCSVTPIKGMLGTRASMLAEIRLEECTIPKQRLVGGVGFGLAAVATSALDIGRYSVAWGSVGIGQACLDACLAYTSQRKQFGVYLKEHQLIQQMITDMITQVKAARLLCYRAGYLKDVGSPDTIMETWIAKYFASTAAVSAANAAVQIHGANGCSSDYSVQRYLRDAKIMEIIEGSNQLQQITIANYGYQEFARQGARTKNQHDE